jgi:hypothetical protein
MSDAKTPASKRQRLVDAKQAISNEASTESKKPKSPTDNSFELKHISKEVSADGKKPRGKKVNIGTQFGLRVTEL